jgi:hypothetical protein
VKPAAPLSRHNPHDARSSGSGLGAAPWSEFALQRQPCVRQAALEQLPTPMPFLTGRFRACVSSSRAAYNGPRRVNTVHASFYQSCGLPAVSRSHISRPSEDRFLRLAVEQEPEGPPQDSVPAVRSGHEHPYFATSASPSVHPVGVCQHVEAHQSKDNEHNRGGHDPHHAHFGFFSLLILVCH